MSSEWKTLRELIETRGINGRVIVSAELGLNHNGDWPLALKMIDAAAEAGCQAVKVQNYRTGDVVKSRLAMIDVDGGTWNAWDLFSRCELDYLALAELKGYAEGLGLIFHSTPTNEQGVRDLLRMKCRLIKIASDVALEPDVVRFIREHTPATILSTGCLDLSDVLLTYGWPDQEALLHCVREYPASKARANLGRIGELRLLLGKYHPKPLVGYSDHTQGIDCAVAAVRDYKACWVEAHVTLDHSLPGPDHRWSKDFTEMKELVKCLKSL